MIGFRGVSQTPCQHLFGTAIPNFSYSWLSLRLDVLPMWCDDSNLKALVIPWCSVLMLSFTWGHECDEPAPSPTIAAWLFVASACRVVCSGGWIPVSIC